jgi:hypothetical protein
VSAPIVTVTAPIDQSSGTVASLDAEGVAVDDTAIASVGVGVRNLATGRWWRSDGTWVSGRQTYSATMDASGAPVSGWNYPWTAPGSGSYQFYVTAQDGAGNLASSPIWRSFTVTSPSPSPTPSPSPSPSPSPAVAPDGTMTSPLDGSTVSRTAFTAMGIAIDDQAVASVNVSVHDEAHDRWLRSDGTWDTLQVWMPATLGSPGASSTDWTFAVPKLPSGSYRISARSSDLQGLTDATPATALITVTRSGKPKTTITVPHGGAVLRTHAVKIRGRTTSTDPLKAVIVRIRDERTGQYVGRHGRLQRRPFDIRARLGRSTHRWSSWSERQALPGPGVYRIYVVAWTWWGRDRTPAVRRILVHR